ncbi:unnamed protein product [Leptidea sinapis]|uniref:Uncharacterized protein n=1 Tax=Leptidea sinapis TaxID=189913 RepID=A0A5E4PYJ4_9NEOP|nr:unnamed protein product [Leptidea sinapis]
MNVTRLPNGSDLIDGRSGSQPNLTYETPRFESHSNFRNKRKHSDDEIKTQLSDIQQQMTQMMALLTTLNENFSIIRLDILGIQNTITEIKSDMQLTKDQLEGIVMDQKQIEIELRKNSNLAQSSEKKDTEFYEQNLRRKNILIAGIPESVSIDRDERHTFDKNEVMSTNKTITPDCPRPINIFRVGKYKPDKIRPIKLYEAVSNTKIFNNNHDYNILEDKIWTLIKQNKTKNTKIINPPKQDWINKSILDDINPKSIATSFIKTKSAVAIRILKLKADYYHKKVFNCQNKTSKMWRFINSLNHNKNQVQSVPTKLKYKDTVLLNGNGMISARLLTISFLLLVQNKRKISL